MRIKNSYMTSIVRSYRDSLMKILIPVGLAIAAGVLFTSISSNGQLGFASGIVFILVGLYPFVRAWMRREFDAFEIINLFVILLLLQLGLQGLMYSERTRVLLFCDINSTYFDILRFKTFSYSIIALLSLYIGYYSRLGNRWLNVLPRLNFDWQKRKALICLIIYFVVGEAALIFLTIKFGNWEGIHSFGKDPSAIQENADRGGTGHISTFLEFLDVVFLVSCIYRFSKRRPAWANIAFFLCILHMVIVFLHYGGKGSVAKLILMYIITRHYIIKRTSLRMCIVIGAALIIILLPSLVYIRSYGIYGNWKILKDVYISSFNNPVGFLSPLVGTATGFEPFALFIDAIDSGKRLELGKPMAFLLYFFIPRAWWPGKPLSFSVTYTGKYANMNYGGCWAPSFAGELYVNFHLIGVVVGFFLVGILLRLSYQYLIKRNLNNTSLLIYLTFGYNLLPITGGGSLGISYALLSVFPAILFLWFVKTKRRRI